MLTTYYLLALVAPLILLFADQSQAVDMFSGPQEFCYEPNSDCGPESDKWSGACRTGKRQSPINIEVGKRWANRYVYIDLHRFQADHFFMQNNGHTINIDFTPVGSKDGSEIFPGYGLTNTKYRFNNAHLHWGEGNGEGSEHQLNGRNFSMELHLVHFKEKYQTLKDAVASGEQSALAVVGIFLQVDPNARPNPALRPVIDLLSSTDIHEKHSYWVKGDTPIDLKPLIPVRYGGIIYSYQGSLTTPTCDEVVAWFVFQDHVTIAPQDAEAFRQILDGRENALKINHRHVKPLNGRKIDVIGIV